MEKLQTEQKASSTTPKNQNNRLLNQISLFQVSEINVSYLHDVSLENLTAASSCKSLRVMEGLAHHYSTAKLSKSRLLF